MPIRRPGSRRWSYRPTAALVNRLVRSTLSYNRRGRPIPSQHRPRLVYEQLFGTSTDSLDAQQAELRRTQSMLDRVLEHSRFVRRKLGKQDQRKFDEYLASVRQIEESVERSRRWLEVPKPQVDRVRTES